MTRMEERAKGMQEKENTLVIDIPPLDAAEKAFTLTIYNALLPKMGDVIKMSEILHVFNTS